MHFICFIIDMWFDEIKYRLIWLFNENSFKSSSFIFIDHFYMLPSRNEFTGFYLGPKPSPKRGSLQVCMNKALIMLPKCFFISFRWTTRRKRLMILSETTILNSDIIQMEPRSYPLWFENISKSRMFFKRCSVKSVSPWNLYDIRFQLMNVTPRIEINVNL